MSFPRPLRPGSAQGGGEGPRSRRDEAPPRRERTGSREERGHGRRLRGLGRTALEPQRPASALGKERLPREGEPFSVHIAPRGLLEPLLEELGDRVLAVRGRAVLAKGEERAVWAQNSWTRPFWLEVASISDAARKLGAVQRRWRAHLDAETGLNRRTTLIEEALPRVSRRPLVFGEPAPKGPLGAFLLWAPTLLLASAETSSPFPDGEASFVENRTEPPGRAYLKLWEAFTLLGVRPKPGELCVELGAAPGSWTWVLAQTGARIFSLDKAPLADHVQSLPNVEHCVGSGFALSPAMTGRVDWLFSDMICYPGRLLELVSQWREAGAMRRALCTIKLQAGTDHETVRAFAAIPGSRIMHLSCNRHELTWFWEEDEACQEAGR